MTKADNNVTGQGAILVVDDTPDSVKLVTDLLTAAGYQAHPASSGELALAAVAAQPPELILLDLHMPGLNGFEVCRRLKARPESRDLPVIFLSASMKVEEWVEGLKLGAVDFISKPFEREELLARVRTHIELRRLHVRLEAQAADLRWANEQLQSEMAGRKRVEAEREQLIGELREALASVKTLSGLVPICATCKKIRDDKGFWSQVETYVARHTEAKFSHGICPECVQKFYPDLVDEVLPARPETGKN